MVVYLAFVNLDKSDGISKKILSQSKALSINHKLVSLLAFKDNEFEILTFENGILINSETEISYSKQIGKHEFVKFAEKYISTNNVAFIYIRHLIPNIKFLGFLIKNKKRIYYEIPTYPYFFEQIKNSNNKVKTIVRILYEIICWPLIYLNVYKIFTILSNDKKRVFKKMILISNGIESENIYDTLENNTGIIYFIGVGTIYQYHGYDLLINFIKKLPLEQRNKIIFNIVGESKTINQLKLICKELKLDNIKFLGKKNGDELRSLYEKSSIGVGTLALERRNANIDTALKNLEYLSHGLPIITSGEIKGLTENKHYIKFHSQIKYKEIENFIHLFGKNFDKYILNDLIKDFTWVKIYKNTIEVK